MFFCCYFQPSNEEIMGYPSLIGHMTSLELINPIHVLPPVAQTPAPDKFRATVMPLKSELPCEVHPLTLRSLQVGEDPQFRAGSEAALLLHRLGVDCSYPSKGVTCKPGQGKVGGRNRLGYIILWWPGHTVTSLLANGSAASVELHCHWLTGLWQYEIAVVIQATGSLTGKFHCFCLAAWKSSQLEFCLESNSLLYVLEIYWASVDPDLFRNMASLGHK